MIKSKTWEKIGQLIKPIDSKLWWMQLYAGATCAIQRENSSLFDIYITGRDKENCSRIGHGIWDAKIPNKILSIDKEPCLQLGPIGSFAESGTSYPSVIKIDNIYYMYFTGWKLGKTVPFYNSVGLAISDNPEGPFNFLSKAPILELTDEEPYGFGSSFCRFNNKKLKYELYYTSFEDWFLHDGSLVHRYCLKKTESTNGIKWNRPGEIIISNQSINDAMICRPSMIDDNEIIFCKRGINSNYQIYSAINENNVWISGDNPCIENGNFGEWDSNEQCYPFIIRYDDKEYMFYSGNKYGRGGLGIASR